MFVTTAESSCQPSEAGRFPQMREQVLTARNGGMNRAK